MKSMYQPGGAWFPSGGEVTLRRLLETCVKERFTYR
jgi:hypothetical protein